MNVFAVCLAAVALSAPHAPHTAGGQEYYSLVVRNDTRATVAYSIRWNRGTTVNYKLSPGGMRIHAVSASHGVQHAIVGWDSNPITGKVNRVAQRFIEAAVDGRFQDIDEVAFQTHE